MDVSDEMIRRARRASVDVENLMFVTGEVEEIPWEPNFFTHAISVESSYYWPDPAAGIREIFRVLRSGGSARILINYYRENPHSHQWGDLLAVKTHLLSAAEWSELFRAAGFGEVQRERVADRSEEHTSELQSPCNLVCRLLLEKKNQEQNNHVVKPRDIAIHYDRNYLRLRDLIKGSDRIVPDQFHNDSLVALVQDRKHQPLLLP